MSKSKTSTAGTPATAGRTAGPGGKSLPITKLDKSADLDAALKAAQSGRVNLSPDKAIEVAGALYSRGQYQQAERVCRQIIAARPANADAHNILGVTLAAMGRFDDAAESITRATRLNPQAPSYHANLGEVCRQGGKQTEAMTALSDAIKLDPNNAQSLNNMGIIHYDQRKFKKAIEFYKQAIEARPAMAEAHNNLGNALRVMGNIDGAIEAYQDALTHRAVYPEAYNNLGTLLQQKRQFDEAEHALRKAIQQNPRYVEAYNNLSTLLSAQKKDVDALRVLGDALKIAPKNVTTLVLTARVQIRRGAHGAAEQALRLALREQPENAEALSLLGQLLHETDRYEEAMEALEKSLEINPRSPEANNFYGVALKSMGRLDEARDQMIKALNMNEGLYGAYANLNDLVDFSEGVGAELFDRMDAIMNKVKNKEADFMLPLHFAYAKALDDRKEHERALEHYILGGKMKRKQLDYTESETFDFFDGIRAAFPQELIDNPPFEGLDDDRLVFIVGMPRSGSTLTEQIISSHPDVFGAGEVKHLSKSIGMLRDRFPSLPKYPQMPAKMTKPQYKMVAENYLKLMSNGAGDKKKITDKLLTNYFFLGLIYVLFPKAKVIHCRRDPVDTCLSGFTKLFKDDMPHSYDLTELGRYYGKYGELMAHWEKVLPKDFLTTVVYEETVANTEAEARRLIDFIGLPWDDACLEFYNSKRPVKTASVAQVRKPIYKGSVKRWAKYGGGLQPLVDAIEDMAKVTGSGFGTAAAAEAAEAEAKGKAKPAAKSKSAAKGKSKAASKEDA